MHFPLKPKIIDILNDNPHGITIAGLSERLKVSRHTISVTLAEMYGAKLINVRRVGMAKLILLKKEKEMINENMEVV